MTDQNDLANMSLTDLTEQKKLSQKKVSEIYPKWRRAQEITSKLQRQYHHAREIYESIDREIALRHLEAETTRQVNQRKNLSPEDKIMTMFAKLSIEQREELLSIQKELLAMSN